MRTPCSWVINKFVSRRRALRPSSWCAYFSLDTNYFFGFLFFLRLYFWKRFFRFYLLLRYLWVWLSSWLSNWTFLKFDRCGLRWLKDRSFSMLWRRLKPIDELITTSVAVMVATKIGCHIKLYVGFGAVRLTYHCQSVCVYDRIGVVDGCGYAKWGTLLFRTVS